MLICTRKINFVALTDREQNSAIRGRIESNFTQEFNAFFMLQDEPENKSASFTTEIWVSLAE